jgi:hypothetical protein
MANQVCRGCQRLNDIDRDEVFVDGVCPECRELGHLSRPARPCADCGGTKILRSQLRHFAEKRAGLDGPRTIVSPINVAYDPHLKTLASGLGELFADVCVDCGATRFWVYRPETIPVGQEYGTALLSAEPRTSGPYR